MSRFFNNTLLTLTLAVMGVICHGPAQAAVPQLVTNSYKEKFTRVTTCVDADPCTETNFGKVTMTLTLPTTTPIVATYGPDTSFVITAGAFTTNFTLSEDPKFVTSGTKAKIKKLGQVNGKTKVLATFKLTWTDEAVVVKMKALTGTDLLPPGGGTVIDENIESGPVTTDIEVDTQFGGYPGSGTISCEGTYAIKTKTAGSFNQDTEKVSLKIVPPQP